MTASETRRRTAARPHARHRAGRVLVPGIPNHLHRTRAVEHRHLDAELHAARLHRRPHRPAGARRPDGVHAARTTPGVVDPRRRARRSRVETEAAARRCRARRSSSRSPSRTSSPATIALWTIFAAQLGIGIANALNAPAFQSSMPLLVHRQDLPGAISLNSAMINGTRVVGPVLAAILAVAGMSVSSIFLVNAATYLFFIAALLIVRMPDVAQRRHRQGLAQPDHRPQHRPAPPGAQPTAARDVPVLALQPRLHRPVPVGRSTEPRHLPVECHLPLAVRDLGAGGLLRGDLGRDVPRRGVDRKVLIVRGFVGFGIALGVFSQLAVRSSPSRSGSSSASSTS